MNKTEILAPVGNMDMLNAAIAAGADSFYLSLDQFGARAYAANFSLENISDAIDRIHLFGKKVFITTNTLIKDHEMDKAISYVQKLYEYGADGLIIQDIGFFGVIKDQVPGLELHASTQMAVRDYYGAKYLQSIGFDRVVIARETPIDEIRKIASLDVETEVFVHGSLCVSYSGECLMSSYFGGRSANRGRCAGPCRQKYELISDGKVLADDYFLNMRDLNVIDNLDDLLDIGVDCIKIEGRMKTPEYVFTAVSNYRSKIDLNYYNKENLLDSSNRGYTKGYIFNQNHDNVVLENDIKHRAVGIIKEDKTQKYFISNSDLKTGDNLQIITDRGKKLPFTTVKDYKKGDKIYLYKYRDAQVASDVLMLNSSKLQSNLDEALKTYENLPVDIEFIGKMEDYPRISISHDKYKVTYKHDKKIEKAKNISLESYDIHKNLSKFNDEIFSPTNIKIDIDDGIFISKKDINECRRQAVSLLKNEILSDFKREKITINIPDMVNIKPSKSERNIELLTNDVDPELIRDFDNIYLRNYDEKYKGANIYLNLDSHHDYEIDELISFIKENDITGVILNNYRDLAFIDHFNSNNIKIRIGRYLNVFNSFSFDFYARFAESICSSVENTYDNINANSKIHPCEALCYGRVELMNMRHCPFSVIKKCGLKGCPTCRFNKGNLRNHDGEMMRVVRYGEYSKIYPEKPSLSDLDGFDKSVSLLYQVSDNDDILNISKAKANRSYQKGVI